MVPARGRRYGLSECDSTNWYRLGISQGINSVEEAVVEYLEHINTSGVLHMPENKVVAEVLDLIRLIKDDFNESQRHFRC